jgi:hypothetical protein
VILSQAFEEKFQRKRTGKRIYLWRKWEQRKCSQEQRKCEFYSFQQPLLKKYWEICFSKMAVRIHGKTRTKWNKNLQG